MFKESVSSGKHMICDIKEINNNEILNDSNRLNNMLEFICEQFKFEILHKYIHNFDPIGCSIIFLLSESHISIHTFPEKNHISFDLYTCRDYKNNNSYEEIYKYIIRQLNASSTNSSLKIIDRFF